MEKLDDDALNFALNSLERNDSSIRFSDSKPGFLFAFSGVLLGLLADDIFRLKKILTAGDDVPSSMLVGSLVLIVVGLLLVIGTALASVFPRMKISESLSFQYFGSIVNQSESNFAEKYKSLSSADRLNHVLSQVHATSIIAKKKFELVQWQLFGTILLFIGWLLAIMALFFFG